MRHADLLPMTDVRRPRRLAALLVAAAVAVGLAGCTPDDRPSKATMVVYLTNEVTPAEKQAIDAKVRSLPSVADVRYESREQAFVKYKFTLADVATVKAVAEALNETPGVSRVTPMPKRAK